ncbi:MAG: hypothetical protein ACE5M4_05255 [Anaerolineales bacterium]
MRIPLFPFAVALFPVLALLAGNIYEVDPRVVLRPLLVTVAATAILLGLFRILVRSWHKAALITTLVVVVFFSYGHLYGVAKNAELFRFIVGRHRYLLPTLGLLTIAFAWWVARSNRRFQDLTLILNIVGIALVALPVMQLGAFAMETRPSGSRTEEAAASSASLSMPESDNLPDVYYIVLDTYGRADVLKRDFGFDNTPFLEELEELGFYVAECGRTNYGNTRGSLTAALNMDYVIPTYTTQEEILSALHDTWLLLKHSEVRRLLEEIGYKTVAFDTGYEWSRLKDADIYLSIERDPLALQGLDPFEELLVNNSAALVLAHREIQAFSVLAQEIDDRVPHADFPLERYAEGQLFILDQLPEIARLSDPTFAFVHILATHAPYVFDSNGEIWSDEGFYYGPSKEPIDEWHWQTGYVSSIEFTNKRMIEILQSIIDGSDDPLIIILQGDHGLREENLLEVLSAYHLPDGVDAALYPSISPVNSFRVVFDGYFGTNYGLIDDLSFAQDSTHPEPETSPECLVEAGTAANR